MHIVDYPIEFPRNNVINRFLTNEKVLKPRRGGTPIGTPIGVRPLQEASSPFQVDIARYGEVGLVIPLTRRVRHAYRSTDRRATKPNFALTAPSLAEHNYRMSSETAATDPLADSEDADIKAVLRHAFEGIPLDQEVARRVDERAARITEQIRRTGGVIDDETFQTLLADDDS